MIIENKIIIIIHEYNKFNCSHLKGLITYLKLKPKIDNLLLIEFNNKFKLYENKHFIEKELELKNNIILFNKFLPKLDFLINLKNNKNILYHEIIDFFYNKKYKNYEEYFNEYQINNEFIFDKIIVNSNHMRNILSKYYNNIFVIYHHYDHRINNKKNIINKVYYLGLREKLELSNEIIEKNNIHLINYNGIRKYLQNGFSCIHICFIFDKTNLLYDNYTSTKLATAIITDSIFICNKIPIFVELLGNDYEFYCEDENELESIIQNAKDVLTNLEEFKKYLEKYNYLKQKLSYQNLLKDYENLFNI